MNCIGGFLLNLTGSLEVSEEIFSFLIHYRMEEFFKNEFSKMSQLIFIAEEVLHRYNPSFLQILSKNQITTDFYMSPIFLTVFTCSLQVQSNIDFNVLAMEIIISEGWFGFIKFFLCLTLKFTAEIEKMDHDEIIFFIKTQIFKQVVLIPITEFRRSLGKVGFSKSEYEYLFQLYENKRKIIDDYW